MSTVSPNYYLFLAWVATMISVFVINLGSLLGLFASPIIKKKWFSLLLLFVISMGVGVLAGDGILHLLPHVSKRLQEMLVLFLRTHAFD